MKPTYFVPTFNKAVALTFDDGPCPGVTDKVVDVLAKHGAFGTFFMTGKAADACGHLAAMVASAGHGVGSHGYSHARGMKEWDAKAMFDDFRKARDAVGKVTGKPPVLARPPFGNVSLDMLAALSVLGQDYVGWSLNSKDWHGGGWAPRVMSSISPGTIVVCHDGGRMTPERVGESLRSLDELLARGGDLGYHFVTVDQLMSMWDDSLVRYVGGKPLLGLRSTSVGGKTMVTPMWGVDGFLFDGVKFAFADDGHVAGEIAPLSNVDDWIVPVEAPLSSWLPVLV